MENELLNTESELIHIATWSDSEEEAIAAMNELRNNYDPTYIWCCDCDGRVVKDGDCCYNKKVEDNDDIDYSAIFKDM